MKSIRVLLSTVLVGAAALSISCGSPSPTEVSIAPPDAPRADLLGLGSLLGHTGLVGCSPLPYDSVTATIGPAGGTIRFGPHQLSIPRGALGGTVTITAVVPSANVNLVRFQPQGLQFVRAPVLAMSYANCGLLNRLLPAHIAYTNDALQILELIPALDLFLQAKVAAPIHHFSNYAVAW
jgi:hypothetical protein